MVVSGGRVAADAHQDHLNALLHEPSFRTLLGPIVFAKAKMPTNPAVASAILKLSADEVSNATDFSKLIRTDPALAIRLLKTANSAQFAQRTPITTIERAVTVLGLSRVKATALGFQLIAHLDRMGGTPFDLKLFWQHALLRGCLARVIATGTIPQRTDEAFLIALLQDCGIVLLAQVLGSSYATLCRSDLSPSAFYATERESFPYTHVDAIAVMSGEWRLPELISEPMKQHHHPRTISKKPASEQEKLADVAYFVGNLCFAGNLQITRDEQTLNDFGATAFALDPIRWSEIQKHTEAEYRNMSQMFEDLLPDGIDVAELLGEANRQLAEAADNSAARVVDIEAQRTTLVHEQKQLQAAIGDYRERAAIDPLTNVLNRGAIMDAARTAIKRNLDESVPLGALFLDIDNIKHLNDTYGQDVGDKVLKSAAAMLGQSIQDRGLVGRYGGEEFVVVLPELSADSTCKVGEDIVQGFRRLDTSGLGCSGPVTCSVGALWADRLSFNSAEELFAAADQLMYKAKRGGKDRCCFEKLIPSSQAAPATSPALHGVTLNPIPVYRDDAKNQAVGIEEILAIAGQLNALEGDPFAGIRKQERNKVVALCTLHYFTGSGSELAMKTCATRNLSTGGVGLLVPRPMIRGEPVEVVLDRGASQLFLAGLVTFCRHIDRTLHEVGIQFVSHSVSPIISNDAAGALHKHEWVNRAYTAKVTGKLQQTVAT